MRIAVIGSGQVGQALAGAFRRAGHTVAFGLRRPDPARADTMSIRDAVASADLAVLAVPYQAAAAVLADLVCQGRIVIDATNPLEMSEQGLGLSVGFTTSGAEALAAAAPQVRLVKAFNQTGFENMAEAHAYGSRPAMFLASDHPEAVPPAAGLAEDIGFEAIDMGPLRQARLLEPLAMLWIELARKRGLGPHFTFAIRRKGQARTA